MLSERENNENNAFNRTYLKEDEFLKFMMIHKVGF